MMNIFSLDTPLVHLFGSKSGKSYLTIRDIIEGLLIFGGIGSGKTSGSGALVALNLLKAGFGGIVLTVKPDEKELWQTYCRRAGREHDLLIVEPGANNYFDFLDYESQDGSFTENIVEVLKTVIRASEEKESGKSDDSFWESALDLLIFNVVDLCKLAYGKVSIEKMYDIVQSLPSSEMDDGIIDGAFFQAFVMAKEKTEAKVNAWRSTLTTDEKEKVIGDAYEFAGYNAVPDARTLTYLDQFFLGTFLNLAEKTRSIIHFSFSSFLFGLLRDPIYCLFCKNASTFTPDDCRKGKIILINLPVKQYHKAGRDCQILFKYVWQRAMEREKVEDNTRPVFLWADEAQNFIHEHDSEYQATARSSRIATVYITQNLPNFYANMGGAKSEYKVKSFLGTLATKIFHANADVETNQYASDLIGDIAYEETSRSATAAGEFSTSQTKSLSIDRAVRPEGFVQLKTGGPVNSYMVEGYIHIQGNPLASGLNYSKIRFPQKL